MNGKGTLRLEITDKARFAGGPNGKNPAKSCRCLKKVNADDKVHLSHKVRAQEATLTTGAPVSRASGDQHHRPHISSIPSSLLLGPIKINAWQSPRAPAVPLREMWWNPLQLFTPKLQPQRFHSPPQGPRWRKKEGKAPPRGLLGETPLRPALSLGIFRNRPKKTQIGEILF
ncbi:hypothetical protein D623_10032687 [Myotis brandtii]|uniref:Uncharacterized protein n=1 Tax=Myotis brandtii TaxID=109478 RepID=S7N4M3_MYOBR|nr:hypothetical protein D623_10032687 [Myotis brandtii]